MKDRQQIMHDDARSYTKGNSRADCAIFYYRVSFFIIVCEMYIIVHDLLPIVRDPVASGTEAGGITAYNSVLQPIAADNAPITSDCSRLQFFAADYSASHCKCNPLRFAAIVYYRVLCFGDRIGKVHVPCILPSGG
jgi:hypothetical protein